MNTERWLLDQFLRWEVRGRGWMTWPDRVALEPPFQKFLGHSLPSLADDGLRRNALGSLAKRFFGGRPEPSTPVEPDELEKAPEVERSSGDKVELQIILEPGADIPPACLEQCLFSLPPEAKPMAFELLGTAEGIVTQFVCEREISNLVLRQLTDHLSGAVIIPREETLRNSFDCSERSLVAEIGLRRPFMVPLPTLSKGFDPYVGLVAVLSELREEETGVVQILFEPVHHPWSESMWKAVTDNKGGPFFSGAPEFLVQTRTKVSRPLFSVVLRLGVAANDFSRCVDLGRSLTASFGIFNQPAANTLIPLEDDELSEMEHEADLLQRATHRSGMILNSDELLSLLHLPNASVRNPKLVRQIKRTKAAPQNMLRGDVFLGINSHIGIDREVWLTNEHRTRHIHIIGTPSSGKSTLLLNIMAQDAKDGAGFALLDPHGDLFDQVLKQIPRERASDVILLDASDEEFPVGFNILSAHSNLEKTLLAADLVSVFQRLSTSWGDQMTSLLGNAILAFLESSRGGTLPELRRFLVDESFRREFLPTVTDPEVLYYWEHEFGMLRSGASIGPLLTRLDTLLRPKIIRNMVGQKENRLDVSEIMDSGKILLVKLPQGLIGESNAFLLGALLVGKFQQMAIARQVRDVSARRPFFLYVDEFHHFVTPSMATILAEARKYRLGLILAHQDLRQLQREEEVASSVLANPAVRICFHVGDQDARRLAEGFTVFEPQDLQQLRRGEAICRIERSDNDFNLITEPPPPEDSVVAEANAKIFRDNSRTKYSRPREEVERDLANLRTASQPKNDPFAKRAAKKAQEPPTEPDTPKEPKHDPPESDESSPAPVPEVPRPNEKRPPIEKAETIKNRIIQTAGGFGFTYETEFLTASGGRIDIVLRKGEKVIACEISATTSARHEWQNNLLKCLGAGYEQIAHVCENKSRRKQMQDLLTAGIAPDEASRVRFFTITEFLTYLQTIGTSDTGVDSSAPGDKTPGVTVSMTAEEIDEDRQRMLDELKRRLRRDKDSDHGRV